MQGRKKHTARGIRAWRKKWLSCTISRVREVHLFVWVVFLDCILHLDGDNLRSRDSHPTSQHAEYRCGGERARVAPVGDEEEVEHDDDELFVCQSKSIFPLEHPPASGATRWRMDEGMGVRIEEGVTRDDPGVHRRSGQGIGRHRAALERTSLRRRTRPCATPMPRVWRRSVSCEHRSRHQGPSSAWSCYTTSNVLHILDKASARSTGIAADSAIANRIAVSHHLGLPCPAIARLLLVTFR